jgi:hypothetical protein
VLLDRDPISTGRRTVLLDLAFVVAGFVLWMLLSGTSRSRHPVFGAIGAAAGVYSCSCAVAGIGWNLALVAEQALSPFVLAADILAAGAVVATWAALRSLRWRRMRHRALGQKPRRPRHPRSGAIDERARA